VVAGARGAPACALARDSKPEKEHAMRLSPAQIDRTLNQFEAHVIPDDHPMLPRIKGVWGDHTYFLADNGLNIVEPLERPDAGAEAGTVVNVAGWSDETATVLSAHEPEATEVVVEFDPEEGGAEPGRMH
jgi:hypothetical protein